jgi:hypothetical protein
LEFGSADLAAGLRLIADALSAAARAGEAAYLDAAAGELAVAAATVVVSINGQPIDESPYNEEPGQWIARTRPDSDAAMTGLARQAVVRVTGPNSELAQLWDESGSPSWRTSMTELRATLDR